MLLALARRHWALLIVLAAAVVLRTLVEVAYWPALMFSDSWEYIELAFRQSVVAFGVDRPSGYPLLIHILSLPGRSLATITIAQHLAGLAIGAIAYALLVRLEIRRWIAALAAALILLDSYLVALEQHVLAETFFALALLGCGAIAIRWTRSPLLMLGSGALLALAVTLRAGGLFAIPAFLLFVFVRVRPARVLGAACAGLAVPLLLYASIHAAAGRGFGFTEQTPGWTLYGRVASIADCRGADIPSATRPLCQSAAARASGFTPSAYVSSPDSPARRLFGYSPTDRDAMLLGDFAIAIIRAHPLRYLELVGDDFAHAFAPGVHIESTLLFPRRESFVWEREQPLKGVRDTYFPRYTRRIDEPAGFFLEYQRVFHTPRWLIGALSIAMLLAAVVRFFGEPANSSRSAYLLLGGMGIGIVLGAVATVELNIRFLVPAIPLLVCGGFLAMRDLVLAISRSDVAQPAPTS